MILPMKEMSQNRLAIIIQARTDSTRFPRKVLSKIKGKSLLWHVIERAKKIGEGQIIVATTTRSIDDEIVSIAQKANVDFFRGKKNDVLDRYLKAALKHNANIIMRITSDCPLIDPIESKKVLKKFLKGKFDYVATDEKSYPKGLDTECFSLNALKRTSKVANTKSDREHVTQYIYNHPKKFRIGLVYNKKKFQKPQRWVVDYKEDLLFVRKIFSKLYKNEKPFLMNDIISLLKKQPNLRKINSKYLDFQSAHT